MKKLSILFLVLALLAGVESCSKRDTTITTDSAAIAPQTSSNAVDAVASDKEMLRQALVLADSKGTLDAALTEAAQDSLLYIKMSEALAKARVAQNNAGTPSKPTPTTQPKTTKKISASGSTSTQSKDALEQAEDAVNKADRAVTKSGEILNKASNVGRKADDILRGKR